MLSCGPPNIFIKFDNFELGVRATPGALIGSFQIQKYFNFSRFNDQDDFENVTDVRI